MKLLKYGIVFLGIVVIALAFISSIKADMTTKEKTKSVVSDLSPNDIKTSKDVINNGEKIKDFTLKDTSGKLHKLSDYRGKKVYIKFWASWCSICLAGLAEADGLGGETKDFIVLSVVSPGFKGEKNSEDFIAWYNSMENKNLIVLLDEKGIVSNEIDVRGYPTSVFLGSDGVLVKKLPGHKNNEEIREIFSTIK